MFAKFREVSQLRSQPVLRGDVLMAIHGDEQVASSGLHLGFDPKAVRQWTPHISDRGGGHL